MLSGQLVASAEFHMAKQFNTFQIRNQFLRCTYFLLFYHIYPLCRRIIHIILMLLLALLYTLLIMFRFKELSFSASSLTSMIFSRIRQYLWTKLNCSQISYSLCLSVLFKYVRSTQQFFLCIIIYSPYFTIYVRS